MEIIAADLASWGYRCRSGGARGADRAFERGDPNALVLRPEDVTPAAIAEASRHHARWDLCDDRARRLHGRNAMIMLGEDLSTHAEFGICWTWPGNTRGGTVLGIRICEAHGIAVYNLAEEAARAALLDRVAAIRGLF
jgi:hypothetical protein